MASAAFRGWREDLWCQSKHLLLAKTRAEDAARVVLAGDARPDRELRLLSANLDAAAEHALEVVAKHPATENRTAIEGLVRDVERFRHEVDRARAPERHSAPDGTGARELILGAPKRVDDFLTRVADFGKVMDTGVECDKCRSDVLGDFFGKTERHETAEEPPKRAPAEAPTP